MLHHIIHQHPNANQQYLVFIHGFCADHQVWDALIPHLQDHYHLLLLDMPGYGKSAQLPQGVWTMEQVADSVLQLLHHYHIPPCIIIGHSMGGYVATTFAERHPEQINGLLLFHTTTFEDSETKKRNRRMAIHLIQKHGTRAFLAAFYDSLFTKAYSQHHNQIINEQEQRALQIPMEVIVRSSEAMIDRPDRSGLLPHLQVPVAYIAGTHDNFTPYQHNFAECYLPAVAKFYLLPQVGHMAMWEDTSAAARAIIQFAQFCQHHTATPLLVKNP